MSVTASIWAWRQIGLRPTEKFVLLTLADRYNDGEGCAWPHIKDIAHRTGCSERTVQRALHDLESRRLMRREPRLGQWGRKLGSNYFLDFGAGTPISLFGGNDPAFEEPTTP